MTSKIFPFLLALVLGGCAIPAHTVDAGHSQKASECLCAKCQCQHCKEGNCDCAHNKALTKRQMCEPR